MRTGVIERRVPMTHVHSADPEGPTALILADLYWAAAAPWSVMVGFRRDGEQVFWRFGLDALAAALMRSQPDAAGDGPVPAGTRGGQRAAAFRVRVEDPAGRLGWLEARTTDVAEFLADALRAMAIRTATA
jgi:hypothetical protein